MGNLEKSAQKKAKRKQITSIILGTVGFAGVLGVALIAPNVLGAMDKMGLMPAGRQKEIINRARDRMLKQGLLRRENGFLRLSPKGQDKLRLLQARESAMKRPRHWDRRWRILIFDIPEYRKGLRDKIRRTLENIGFVRLQDSVWAYPYDCEDLVTLLKADLRIGKDLLYMIVEELEGDRHLKQRFGIH
ncbi:MAG TPA: CRISPR-associated endonuclease Cas2 [Candidatus Paceibacterota bacterium]